MKTILSLYIAILIAGSIGISSARLAHKDVVLYEPAVLTAPMVVTAKPILTTPILTTGTPILIKNRGVFFTEPLMIKEKVRFYYLK